ncbi:ABC transporter ATP-binding protein [Georgenia faecalis]|uniref:ABC transporter ATP-binding protein n=1 Tax=Georgenia faecalis TaxID=2483799 RepID=UPI000FDB4FF4|nr:ABC transporter ATP-binding protein [Georgenia faecalis]
MTGFAVQVRDLGVRYGDTQALDGASLDLPAGAIVGLLGRNGSGKTTLLSVLAALRKPSTGSVLVDGEDPFENERVMERVCLIRESGDVMADEKLSDTLDLVAAARPTWDGEYAAELLDAFELSLKKRPGTLSRGQRSAVGAVIGLASRAPLTIFDEVYLGMDAPSRYRFYDALLADYVEHPRTIILSSHLISEVERLFEEVVVLEAGRVLLAEDADSVRARGATVTGPKDRVAEATRELTVIGRRDLGPTAEVTVFDALGADERARLDAAGLDIGPVGLQDLFVHLTGGKS